VKELFERYIKICSSYESAFLKQCQPIWYDTIRCQSMLLAVWWEQNFMKDGTLTPCLLLVRLKAFTGVHQDTDHLRWAGKNRLQLTCSKFPEYRHILHLPPLIIHFCILPFSAVTPLHFDFIFP
jgi:hypothetical protein